MAEVAGEQRLATAPALILWTPSQCGGVEEKTGECERKMSEQEVSRRGELGRPFDGRCNTSPKRCLGHQHNSLRGDWMVLGTGTVGRDTHS